MNLHMNLFCQVIFKQNIIEFWFNSTNYCIFHTRQNFISTRQLYLFTKQNQFFVTIWT